MTETFFKQLMRTTPSQIIIRLITLIIFLISFVLAIPALILFTIGVIFFSIFYVESSYKNKRRLKNE